MEQATAREPRSGVVAQPESNEVPAQQRIEQAYQSLVAEGKKPSGRALAERAHVHRSTCVEWLRMMQQWVPENEPLLEEPKRNGLAVPEELPSTVVMDLSRKALEHKAVSVQSEQPDTAMMELSEMEMNQHNASSNVLPGIFPDFSLPEDTPDVK